MNVYKKYIAAISFGLLMGPTAYGASGDVQECYYDKLVQLHELEYQEALAHIASLPEGTDLNAPGALEGYPRDFPHLNQGQPPLHACLEYYYTHPGVLKALLETSGVDVDSLHKGVTPLYEALTMKFFHKWDQLRYEAAHMLVVSGASLFTPCKEWVTNRFMAHGKPLIYVPPYFVDYRFGCDLDTSTPFELALQSFMYITHTTLESHGYFHVSPQYEGSAKLLGKILKTGLEACTVERLGGDDGPLKEHEIPWHDADMCSDSTCKRTCYKILQPGDLPALVITKRAYDMIYKAA